MTVEVFFVVVFFPKELNIVFPLEVFFFLGWFFYGATFLEENVFKLVKVQQKNYCLSVRDNSHFNTFLHGSYVLKRELLSMSFIHRASISVGD